MSIMSVGRTPGADDFGQGQNQQVRITFLLIPTGSSDFHQRMRANLDVLDMRAAEQFLTGILARAERTTAGQHTFFGPNNTQISGRDQQTRQARPVAQNDIRAVAQTVVGGMTYVVYELADSIAVTAAQSFTLKAVLAGLGRKGAIVDGSGSDVGVKMGRTTMPEAAQQARRRAEFQNQEESRRAAFMREYGSWVREDAEAHLKESKKIHKPPTNPII